MKGSALVAVALSVLAVADARGAAGGGGGLRPGQKEGRNLQQSNTNYQVCTIRTTLLLLLLLHVWPFAFCQVLQLAVAGVGVIGGARPCGGGTSRGVLLLVAAAMIAFARCSCGFYE